jgi:cytochrome c oxidase cbb3-type subunit 3
MSASDNPVPATPADATPAPTALHVYDGIEEQDNRLPNWWLGILFGSVAFAFAYWFVFETTHAAPGPLGEYQVEMAALAKLRAEGGPVTNESIAVLAQDQGTVGEGQKVFRQVCTPCHGPEGAGVVGPNLTDKFWLHGGTPVEIHKSITEGFPAKGMPAWAPVLGATRVRALAAFVVSQRGKNLPGKSPQGLPVE